MGESCLDNIIAKANEAINDGLDEFEDFVNTNGEDTDVDSETILN